MKLKPSPQELYLILKDAAMAFSQDNAPRLAAATAYYAISSIGPLVFLAIAIAGILLHGKTSDPAFVHDMTQKAMGLVQDMLGPSANDETLNGIHDFVVTLLNGVGKQFAHGGANTVALLTGFVTLFMTTTGLFLQFQSALNDMWGVKPRAGIAEMVRIRIVGFLMVIAFTLLVVAYIALNTRLTSLSDALGAGTLFARGISGGLAMLFFTPVFAALYKWLPAVRLRWQQVWVGGAVTAVLFVLAQAAIGIYFGRTAPGSIYGGASTLFVILLWIYFSSMVIFFGAEVTWVYSQHMGTQLTDTQGNPLPSDKAQQMRLQSLPKRPTPRGYVPQHVPPAQRPRLSTTIFNALLALLALPSVLILRMLGLASFFERRPDAPKSFRYRHYPPRASWQHASRTPKRKAPKQDSER